jgi:hypothetical protein
MYNVYAMHIQILQAHALVRVRETGIYAHYISSSCQKKKKNIITFSFLLWVLFWGNCWYSVGIVDEREKEFSFWRFNFFFFDLLLVVLSLWAPTSLWTTTK